MKKGLLLVLIPALFLTACEHKIIAEFKVTNNTPYAIDSLSIDPNIDLAKHVSLHPKETILYKANMAGLVNDGSYILSYKLNNIPNHRAFGYYSNGMPLEYLTAINIGMDSVTIVKEY